jgi:hypothetical protein
MAFLLADSFQSSLDKLNGEEQKAAKLAAFELQINPANPGLQCHRLDNIKDKNFWSARASRDMVIASDLPGEAAEAIIDLATGTTPTKPEVRQPDQINPYEHPDAQRRFRVPTGTEELARALDYPWEPWIVFLHPSQADLGEPLLQWPHPRAGLCWYGQNRRGPAPRRSSGPQ